MTDDVEAVTPSVVQELLARHGLAPRRSDGQNFLVDPNTVERLLAAADLHPKDHVLEVGPGLGSMTLALQHRVAGITAVEIDAGLAEVVAGLVGPAVDVVHDDVLRVDLQRLVPAGSRLLSNLPYNAATPILLRVLDSGTVADAFVMTQREVGARWTARAGDDAHGAVSVKVALWGRAEIAMQVPRTVFLPVPNVDSVMVRVLPRPTPLDAGRRRRIGQLAELGFRQRRKTLRNNLLAGLGRPAVEAVGSTGIDVGRRAETLTVAEWTAAADACEAQGVHVPATPW